jgi:two-component system sensor histidine kinase KdpD
MPTTSVRRKREAVRSVARAAAGPATALLLNYCAFRLHLNLSTASSTSLLVIVLTALKFGFWEATGSSLVAVACLDYFFTLPVLSFRIVDPQDWMALASFEFTALVVSRLSIQVQNHVRQAVVHRRNAEKLYELSRGILLLNRQEPPGPQIARLIIAKVKVDAVALFDSTYVRSDTAGLCNKEDEELARNAYLCNTSHDDPESQKWVRVLRVGSRPIGVMVLCGGGLTPMLVDAVASLVANAVERARSFEKESRAEAVRYSERLRKTVLDGLAHAFKTPLTVIHTGTSGLLEMRNLSPAQTELVEMINQQSTELNVLTDRFLRMAKLESAEVQLRREQVAVPQLIDEILGECTDNLYGHSVQVCISDNELVVPADRQLLAMTITELLVNAAKYSSVDSPIAVSAERQDDRVVVAVHNDGPVIAPEERELIFESFYRSPTSKHRAPGSGVGLAFAKKLAVAHRGNVWVRSERETGTTFFLSLPARAGRERESITN